MPALRAAIGDKRLELITHCLTGTGPQVALEAAVYGADQIMTAVDPLANGNSLPSAQMIARDLRALGFDVNVDDRLLDDVGAYLGKLADDLGYPVGVPAEFDPSLYQTQYMRRCHDQPRGTAEAGGHRRQNARGDRGDRPGARGVGLAGDGHTLPRHRRRPGRDERPAR